MRPLKGKQFGLLYAIFPNFSIFVPGQFYTTHMIGISPFPLGCSKTVSLAAQGRKQVDVLVCLAR